MSRGVQPTVDAICRERQAQDWATAYRWLCQRRQHAPANADVWDVRSRWAQQYARWLDTVLAGEYRLSPMQVYRRRNQRWVQWSAQDARVLKWVALQIGVSLPRP